MTQKQSKDEETNKRVEIINIVKGPLNFFTLALLIIEAGLGIGAAMSTGSDRTYLIVGMIVIMALVIITVAIIAVFKPGSLYSLQRPSEFLPTIKSCLTLFKKTVITCEGRNIDLRLHLLKYDAAKGTLSMYLQDDDYEDNNFHVEVKTGAAQGFVICLAIEREGIVCENLPQNISDQYANLPVPKNIKSVMAAPIKNANGEFISVVALDSSLHLEDLGIGEEKIKGIFLNLCNVVENILQAAGKKSL